MHSMNDYYSAIQLRSDRWSALRDATGALARGPSEKAADKLHNTAGVVLFSNACVNLCLNFNLNIASNSISASANTQLIAD